MAREWTYEGEWTNTYQNMIAKEIEVLGRLMVNPKIPVAMRAQLADRLEITKRKLANPVPSEAEFKAAIEARKSYEAVLTNSLADLSVGGLNVREKQE